MTLKPIPALLLGILLAAPARAAGAPSDAASDSPSDHYSVKISLSDSDPDVHRGTSNADLIDFYVYLDGGPSRGAEFGVDIEGGTLVAYVIDTKKTWVALPMENPYPGTIAQVKAGPDCFDPPIYFGRLMVRPDQVGGPVTLRVIPSVRASQAAVLHCDNAGTYELEGYHAAVNTDPPPHEHLVSKKQEPAPGHEAAKQALGNAPRGS